jgi:hypothetical protein
LYIIIIKKEENIVITLVIVNLGKFNLLLLKLIKIFYILQYFLEYLLIFRIPKIILKILYLIMIIMVIIIRDVNMKIIR